ncbi:RNA-guided endonuclease TnpB family protein [Hydrogenibacillus sp. N12]|uniref:RNA-guided endonuclease TnpB family protein n=1 Tax=Hydrogenibacillus sp. N12 TaxID=2866627 RepID=UPI001C7D40DC|nr:RNA-guided endonuclease TnpB family protein [Hydrogenibacillus sp. N12]QZA32700.1 transposase [Hydrogenibacillus sp. N12]
MQTITLRLRLHRPTQAKIRRYRELVERTTALANNLVAAGRPKGLTSRTARAYLAGDLPSAVINQVLRDVAAHRDVQTFRVLWPSFNNQNLRLKKVGDFWTASFPTPAGRVRVPLAVTPEQAALLERLGRDVLQGAAKLYEKRGRWFLALSVTLPVEEKTAGTESGKIAGIDMGLRYLAVVNAGGETLFFSGDQAAYVRRRYHALRRRMGKAKALKAIRQMKDKEARWMKDRDHKISRAIVDWCLARGVGIIRMEKLEGIRRRNTRKRDFGRSLHSWSFYRLQQFIAYKARLAGIRVEWVNPKDTSRTCPRCGHCASENRSGIRFRCRKCGYQGHADVVGAWNVSLAMSGLAEAA